MDLTLLDVAIGMVMIYSLLSLICSTINEGISSFFALRAATLKSGLENLLGSSLAKDVYDHHLVQGLVQQDILVKWKRKPSYIPTRTFVLTLLDTLGNGFPKTADDVRLAVQKIPDAKIQRALLTLVDDAQGDLDKIKKNFGVWFDHSMDRVSGWYRRKVQLIILVLGILTSFGIGVDTIATVKLLWGDSVLRSALVAAAQAEVAKKQPPPQTAAQVAAAPAAPNFDQVGKNLKDLQSQFSSLEIPTYPPNGICAEWNTVQKPRPCPKGWWSLLTFWLRRHWLGFIITSAALSLGAPFWFDLLNKLVSMRSAGQKPVPEAAVIQAQGQS
ncbi:MAG: hypothetical protein ACJ76Y_29550 [Thermoanaerobaculia bacterium]